MAVASITSREKLNRAGTSHVPSAKAGAALLAAWGKERPVVVVLTEDEANAAKSLRNLERVVVTTPAELEIAAVVWARSLLVTEAALPLVQGRAS